MEQAFWFATGIENSDPTIQNGKLRVDQIYGDGLGITIGSEVSLAQARTAGARCCSRTPQWG